MSYRLLVADGHWLIRRGLVATLQKVTQHKVICECANSHDAVARTIELRPHIALISLTLPGIGGIAALRMIKDHSRDQKVMLLSDQLGVASVRDALRAGCDGYVKVDRSDAELLEAIDSVRSGKVYLDAETSRHMVLSDYRSTSDQQAGPLDLLTSREHMVFRLIGAGGTNRTAGMTMQISPKTVEKYRAALMQKLGLKSAVELRLLALELGLTSRAGPASPAGAEYAGGSRPSDPDRQRPTSGPSAVGIG